MSDSESAEKILRKHWDSIGIYETVYALFLDRKHDVIGIHKVGQGGISTSVVDPKLIFSAALNTLASSIIVAHNHPSGRLTPSSHDRKLTERLKQAGTMLDMPVHDHLILAPDSDYFSFADEGIL